MSLNSERILEHIVLTLEDNLPSAVAANTRLVNELAEVLLEELTPYLDKKP